MLVNADLVPGENGTLCRVYMNDISSCLPSLSYSITVKGRGGGGLTLLQSYYIVSRLKGGRIKWAYEYMHEIMSKVYVTLFHVCAGRKSGRNFVSQEKGTAILWIRAILEGKEP